MSGSLARLNAISAVNNTTSTSKPLNFMEEKPTDLFGCNVFNDKVMQEHLPKAVYKSLKRTIENGEQMDPSIADAVASAMKEWALSRGATHYTHVFYPLTGLTAEKHDSFLEPDGRGAQSPNSLALPLFRVNLMHPASLTAVCVPPSKLAATPHGTLQTLLTS